MSVKRIAIPLTEKRLALHFGHCEEFALVDVDEEKNEILNTEFAPAPPHQPGLLPQWLAERGAGMIIARGMGQRAQALFQQQGIEVMIGAPSDAPEAVVQAYLDGVLETGANICDH